MIRNSNGQNEQPRKVLQIGARIYTGLYSRGRGAIYAIHGEQRPETVGNMSGCVVFGGSASFDIVFEDGGRTRGLPESVLYGVQWQILTDEPNADADELAQLLANCEADEKEQAEQEKRDAERRAAERKEHAAKNPHLITCGEHERASKTAARNIRTELKAAFPGCKFSVTSDFNSIDVRWTDGPSTGAVRDIIGKYKRGWFDGMTDCYEFNKDATWPDVFGGAQYVSEARELSEELEARLVASYAALTGQTFEKRWHNDKISGHSAALAVMIILGDTDLSRVNVIGIERNPDKDGGLFADCFRPIIEQPAQPAPVAVANDPGQASPNSAQCEAGRYDIQSHRHTKRNFIFWLCVPTSRLSRETFEQERERCKGAGGWYSRQWGATPGGFAFEQEADARAFAGGDVPASPGQDANDSGPANDPQPTPDAAPVAVAPSITSSNAKKLPAPGEERRAHELRTAEKLEALADGLTEKIEEKFRPMTQNYTPKRGVQEKSRRIEGANMERAQKAMRALAALYRGGDDVPPLLLGYRTKGTILDALATIADGSGGYYSLVDTGEYRDKSPAAVALQNLIAPKSDADKAAALAAKRADAVKQKIDALRLSKIDGFFPTPDELARDMIGRADLRAGCSILEPSAGIGNLADVAREASPESPIVCVERLCTLADILSEKGYNTANDDFLEWAPQWPGRFDRVVMNPPFEHGQDAQHICAAFDLLAPGGRLVALCAGNTLEKTGGKFDRLRALFNQFGKYREKISGAFDGAGAFRSTGVCVEMIILEKPTGDDDKAQRDAQGLAIYREASPDETPDDDGQAEQPAPDRCPAETLTRPNDAARWPIVTPRRELGGLINSVKMIDNELHSGTKERAQERLTDLLNDLTCPGCQFSWNGQAPASLLDAARELIDATDANGGDVPASALAFFRSVYSRAVGLRKD